MKKSLTFSFAMLLGAAVTSAIKKNFEYSSSLTDIRKVSGLTMQDVNKLCYLSS